MTVGGGLWERLSEEEQAALKRLHPELAQAQGSKGKQAAAKPSRSKSKDLTGATKQTIAKKAKQKKANSRAVEEAAARATQRARAVEAVWAQMSAEQRAVLQARTRADRSLPTSAVKRTYVRVLPGGGGPGSGKRA